MKEVPVVAPTPRDGYWILLEDMMITVEFGGRKVAYFIPKGFITDFASVPRALWWLVSPTDYSVLRASLLHDYLYRTGNCSRKHADRLFYRKLIEDGTPEWKAKLIYWAVRLFARRVWEGYRSKEDD